MAEHRVDELYEQIRRVAPTHGTADGVAFAQVRPGIRVLASRTPTLPPATHTNVYLVGPERGAQLLIDPGSPYADQQELLDNALADEARAGRPLARIALTHHHGDHVGGARATAERWDVPVIAHATTAALLDWDGGAIEPELADGVVLADGGIAVECVFTPGHAAGHICFDVAGADAMIAGDMVAGIGTILIDPDEGDMAAYLRSLEQLRARGQRALMPAHGPVIDDGVAKLSEYLAHRRMREERIATAAARGPQTLRELVSTVYADTPVALWPLAERSLLAHLAKLVGEGRVRKLDQGRWARV